MTLNDGHTVRYAPLFVDTFPFVVPRKFVEAQRFLGRYQSYEDIEKIGDKLRWCRHRHGWMQSEVAEKIGVGCARYKAMEAGDYGHIPFAILDKLAELYEIEPDDLMDDYGRFLQYGAARFVQEYRERLGMTRTGFAEMLGVQRHPLADWETGKKNVSRKSWKRHFKEPWREA